MSTMDQTSAYRSTGRIRKRPGGTFTRQLSAFMVSLLDPWPLFRGIQREARCNAAKRELDLLSDYYFNDVGLRRKSDWRTDDLVKRLRAGG